MWGFRKVYILPDGLFACFLTDAIFQEKNCRRVKSSEIESGDIDLFHQSSELFNFSANRGFGKLWLPKIVLGPIYISAALRANSFIYW